MKMNRFQFAVLVAACVVTVLLRVRNMPMHLDSMIALTLLCGALVRHPAAILLPLALRVLTDVVLWYGNGTAFYPSIVLECYVPYLLIAVLARHAPAPGYAKMIAGMLLGPFLFFALSNLSVWFLWPQTYAPTFAGLINCYTAGLPYLRHSIAGNLPFAVLLLAAWHVATVWNSTSLPVASADSGNDG